jgi:hypothetical protein
MSAIATITAAASRLLGGKGKGSANSASNGSATLAWDCFETIPEVGAFSDWVSNAMSGATLFAGYRGPDGEILPAAEGSRAAELVASIAGGPEGQGVMLGDAGTQLCVTGDLWLIVIPAPESDNMADDRWVVLSTEEVTVQRGKLKAVIDGEEIEIPEYDPKAEQDPTAPVYMRIWKPSPRRHSQATSPVIRSLVVLEELRLLNAAVAAIAKSRITGRGILLIPAGTRFPTQPGQDGAEDSLLDTFIEVASTAIREPDSAAATVPIVLEVPGDLISGVKWLQFTSEFDAMALQLRDEAVRRFAAGADIPAEILLGMGDANHWGAWAITAEALRLGAEPRLALICQSLTTQWLQPILASEGEANAAEFLVWYDTSGLRASSNKGASALEAFKLGLISDQAARRELGFTEADAPGAVGSTPDEQQTATTQPEGGTLPVDSTQSAPNTGTPNETALAASEAVLDSFTAGTDAALAEAVDGLVWSALVVAGRKLTLTPVVPRPNRGTARELAARGSLHTSHPLRSEDDVNAFGLLNDAWVRVPVIAARYGVDSIELTSALHDYVTALLVTGQPHEFDNVPRLLAQLRVKAVAA